MIDPLQSEHADHSSLDKTSQKKPVPHGIGMAVAFDWGLAVQVLIMPFLPLFSQNLNPFRLGGLSGLKLGWLPTWGASFLVSLPFVVLLVVFGESMRRGWRWGRPIQIVVNALGFLGGLASLGSYWQNIKTGNYWSLVTSVILLIFSPLIAWQLSRPTTGRWFASISSDEARKRHGGVWPWLIAIWSVIGGVLQALAASQR